MRDDRPSSTATLIAAATVFLAGDPAVGRAVPDAAVGPSTMLVQAARRAKGSRLMRFLLPRFTKPWCRRLVRRMERRAIPGLFLHYALRKRYLEDAARKAIAQGFTQIIVLGAGFDTLALRLHTEFPKVAFIELDHAPTQRVKLQALARLLHTEQARNVALCPADFSTQTLVQALAACPIYKATRDTLFIAEGLLMYLSEELVSGLVGGEAGARAHPAKRARLAFTFLEPQSDGRIDFPKATRAADRWLQRKGETFRWGLPRGRAAEWLSSQGFTLTDLAGSQTFRHHYLAGLGAENQALADGEYACIADRR